MKKSITILLAMLVINISFSQSGFKGGWIEYRHVVDQPIFKLSIYEISVHVYGFGRVSANDRGLQIYDALNGERLGNAEPSPEKPTVNILSNQFSSCANTDSMNNKYKISTYDFILKVPISSRSYFLTYSFNGRDSSIVNISGPFSIGILISNTILGTLNGLDYHTNSSLVFQFTDTFSVCRNMPFTFPVKVTRRNGDSLSYRFGDAIDASYDTTSPPLIPVVYVPPFSGSQPMGSAVVIDSVTGVISGIAPDMAGGYNITVYVDEWLNGILINTTRKESQIKVTNCPFVKPLLKPLYSSCRVNTFTFTNEPTCPNITSWLWDFGDAASANNTSTSAKPTHIYPGRGSYTLKLKIANNDGYEDSATSIVKIFDSITVAIRADTAVCITDAITLRPVSNATNYIWRETGGGKTLSSYIIKTPKALPKSTTTYYVTGKLDNCRDSTKITVYASPYPKAKLGADTVICVGERAYLNATISGAIYKWSPTSSLFNSNTLQPIAYPQKTTSYILSVNDTFYCPKTVTDTQIVKVVPRFTVDAGKDESVVVGQNYQFNATSFGNTEILTYTWQPAAYFLNNTVSNAIAVIGANTPEVLPFRVTATTVVGGCTASDDVNLKVYKIGPDILVPTAFTPNGDGKIDVLKPILIGMKNLDFFSVYNRYGQVIFTTSDASKGWNGNVSGLQQPIGTYVMIVQGIDYTGKKIVKQGTVILMR